MSESTATVELLTAEVRVLMVGSRQVTLSVAKQLDRIMLDHLEPFGRVRIGGDERLVIGKDKRTGVLAVANYETYWETPVVFAEGDAKFRVCNRLRTEKKSGGLEGYQVVFEDRRVILWKESTVTCDVPHSRKDEDGQYHRVEHACDSWDVAGQRDEIRLYLSEYDEERTMHEAARDLPLIVLAGLK